MDTNSLRENSFGRLFIDSRKRLWFTTLHWLYLYHSNGEWFEHFNINALTTATLDHICFEDQNQLILAGSTSLYKFDMKEKKFSLFNHVGLAALSGGDYKKDEDGIEWFGSKNGLIRYDPKTQKRVFIDSIHNFIKSDYYVNNIILLTNGYLLASTFENGFLLVNRRTLAFKEFHTHRINPDAPLEMVDPGMPIYNRTDCVYKLNDSIILCSCSGGVSIFNWQRETFTYFKPNKSDPTSLLESNLRIYCIFKDRESIIWLGGKSLEKYDYKDYKVSILSLPEEKTPSKPFVPFFDLYRCANGKFLLGSFSNVGVYDTIYGLKDFISLVRVNFFQEDNRGNVWCRIPDGIGFFNINQWENNIKKYRIPSIQGTFFNIKTIKRVRSIIARYKGLEQAIKVYKIPGNLKGFSDLKLDKKGRILVATNGGGLVIFDTTSKRFTFFNSGSRPPSQLTSSSTTALCEDHDSCIWIGTQKGINKIEKDGITVKQYSQNNKKNSVLGSDWWINDIKEDKHGVIWFTTNENGIGRIDPTNDSVSFFSIAQGMPTCWFDQLCIDDNDNLWALSKMGLLNLNVVTLQNKLYTEEEGFPSPGEIQTIHYSRYTKKLYILTPHSILEVNSKNSINNGKIPETTITSVSIFNKEYPISSDNEITLQHNQNFIDIQFACLFFHSNNQIKYAYKIDGIDHDWVYCNYLRDATYTNLLPGRYVFNVKAQGSGGEWNTTPTKLTIIIEPPVWQTWWFYLGEWIAAIAFFVWIVKLYTTRKLSRQKIVFENQRAVSIERIRIALDMHDDLGAGLTSIRLLSEVANLKTDKNSPAKTEIEKIVKSAENLSQNLREIIWTMKSQFDKLEDFIIYIRTYAVEFFDTSAINFQFNKPVIIPDIPISGELRRNIFLCIKEALNNIVKHSRATEVALLIDVVNKFLFIEINDNGIGIDSSQINKFGNGLKSIKDRLTKCGSELKIEINNGTTLKFEINVDK